MIPVRMSEDEFIFAGGVGLLRYADSRRRNLRHRRPGRMQEQDVFRIGEDVLGACGESVFCKGLRLEWPATVGVERHLPDVPPDWQVKTTRHGRGHLRVRHDDDPAQRFALVTGIPPVFALVGWIWAADAQRFPLTDPFNTGDPCHWIPQHLLEPFGTGNAE